MLPASSGTPEQLRLVDIQLKSVGLHPAIHLINACLTDAAVGPV